jgi:hypothetical protein
VLPSVLIFWSDALIFRPTVVRCVDPLNLILCAGLFLTGALLAMVGLLRGLVASIFDAGRSRTRRRYADIAAWLALLVLVPSSCATPVLVRRSKALARAMGSVSGVGFASRSPDDSGVSVSLW